MARTFTSADVEASEFVERRAKTTTAKKGEAMSMSVVDRYRQAFPGSPPKTKKKKGKQSKKRAKLRAVAAWAPTTAAAARKSAEALDELRRRSKPRSFARMLVD